MQDQQKDILRLLIMFFFWSTVSAIGLCREDHPCLKNPTKPGQTCKCWSTCSPVPDARKCDGAAPDYTGYERDQRGGFDSGCNFIPLSKNARDLCVWYYDPDMISEELTFSRFFKTIDS
eukprot:snap_masked-scaffold_5-processed-gene-18.30-mRNA-1 protein AED:1.00 eAED:1.00 QI:0/-1/0/0/-1/1/1/0/118